jgi:aspartyl-tRNA(Asn)/glutamyl-tRNA(Gln) amidotransferase subunit C
LSVTVKDVEYVASLARLRFTEEEKKVLTSQLNAILAHMEKLNELDTTNVEPLAHVHDVTNVFREDVVTPSLPRDAVLGNAPDRSEKFFRVPRVISGEKR